MGRKTEFDNDDEQQSLSNVSRMSSYESQNNSNRDLNEYKMNDIDDNDPLIHDSILPHRKRIRKDTLQYIQSQQSSTPCKIVDVSFFFFFFSSFLLINKEKNSISLVKRNIVISVDSSFFINFTITSL
jgi:hypothetical protein